jgi:Icc-related predicted phosphoesterase
MSHPDPDPTTAPPTDARAAGPSFPVLAVSDEIDDRIYSPSVRQRMGHVALVVGCGDLPARYLEFLADALDKPVYYVLGNHAEELTRKGERGKPYEPAGAVDLGGRVTQDPMTGLILAGIPGSPRYGENEPAQYSEWEVYLMIARMLPRLWWNRLTKGRALDVLVTHSPARGVNDVPDDPAHRGFEALRRFLGWFRPAVHLHGHVHLYDRSKPHSLHFAETEVVNVFPYRVVDLRPAGLTGPALLPARGPSPRPDPSPLPPASNAQTPERPA